MKKHLKLFIFSLLLFIPFCVKAGSVSVTLDCPKSSVDEASCTLSVNPNGSEIKEFSASLNIDGGSYKSFVLESNVTEKTNSSRQISVSFNEPTSSSVLIGTLTVKMPDAGTTVIRLTDVSGIDSSNGAMSGSSVSTTIKTPSSVNTLDSLTIEGAEINFNKNTTNYEVEIEADSTVIEAEATDENAKVTGTGEQKIKYGKNTFNIDVESESGAKKTYTIIVTRPDKRSKNNYLATLVPSEESIKFKKTTNKYTIEVGADISKIRVDATLDDSKAKFKEGYGPRTVNLDYGKNVIQIIVVAENGDENLYNLNVVREDKRSSNANLSSLEISSGKLTFKKNQTIYKVVIDDDLKEITIKAKAEDSKAKVDYDSVVKLGSGKNEAKIKVTAENGKTKEYKIRFIRKSDADLDDNNYLSSLKIKGYDLAFDKSVFSYILWIKSEKTLNIKAKAESEYAIVDIIGNESLKNGSKIIIKVTAENDEVREYELIIKTNSNINEKGKIILYMIIGFVVIGLVVSIVLIIKNKKSKKSKKKEEKKEE